MVVALAHVSVLVVHNVRVHAVPIATAVAQVWGLAERRNGN